MEWNDSKPVGRWDSTTTTSPYHLSINAYLMFKTLLYSIDMYTSYT